MDSYLHCNPFHLHGLTGEDARWRAGGAREKASERARQEATSEKSAAQFSAVSIRLSESAARRAKEERLSSVKASELSSRISTFLDRIFCQLFHNEEQLMAVGILPNGSTGSMNNGDNGDTNDTTPAPLLASVLGKMREALEQMLVPCPLDPWHAAAKHVATEHQDMKDPTSGGATSGASGGASGGAGGAGVLAEVVDAVRGGGSGEAPLTLDFTHRIAAKQM